MFVYIMKILRRALSIIRQIGEFGYYDSCIMCMKLIVIYSKATIFFRETFSFCNHAIVLTLT